MDAPPDRVRARGRGGQSGRVSRPILVGYDVTAPNRRPIEFGIGAARCTGASRIVVCVYATPTPADRLGSRQEDEDLVADAARAIDDVEHVLPTVNLTIECRAVDGTNVARGLHEAATSARARLLVAGSTRLRCSARATGLTGRAHHARHRRVRSRWFRAIGSHDRSAPRSAWATRTSVEGSKRCVEPTRSPAGSARRFAS